MKEINGGLESANFSPHNGGLNTADVIPDQCPSNLSGSHNNAPAIDRSGTEGTHLPHLTVNRERNELKWYIVLFDKPNQELKFKKTVKADEEHTKNILEVYCPTKVIKEYQKGKQQARSEKTSKVKNRSIPYREAPLFAGSDFVYASYQSLSIYLKDYYPSGSIQFKRRLTANQKSEPLTVPDKQMYEFMNFNDNMIDYVVKLNKPFTDYAFNKKEDMPNDTLKIIDGPLAGLTGYFTKISGNRGMVFNVTNPYGGDPFTFAVPNIWNFHVVRLHNAEQDKQTIATAKLRAVDLLIGLLQGSGYADTNIASAFTLLLDKLAHGISLQKAVADLIAQRRAVLEDTFKQEKAAHKEGTAKIDKRPTLPIQEEKLQLTKHLAQRIKDLTAEDNLLLLNLGSYVKDFPQYIKENYKQFSFRPFLTPTSGVDIPDGNDYAVVDHSDYKEIVQRVAIEEDVYYPSKGENKKEKNIIMRMSESNGKIMVTSSLPIGISFLVLTLLRKA